MKMRADLRQFSDHFDYEEVKCGVYRVIGAKVDVFFYASGKWRVGNEWGRWGIPLRKYLEKYDLHDSLKPVGYPHYLARHQMGFGKHEGEFITDLPTDYLEWMAENASQRSRALAKAVLKHRAWVERASQPA